MKWFSRENLRFRRFNWILRGKTPAELSKKGLRWQKNNWEKWYFTSIDLILEIVMSKRTIFFRILAESFKQGCQYCILRVEMNIFRKDIFYWNKLSISIYFTILRKKILDIQRKKSILSELHLICPEAKLYEKMFFFLDSIQFYTFVRTVTKTHSKVRLKSHLWVLQTGLYVSEWKIRTKWLSFEPFIFKFFPRLWAENIQQWYENLFLRVQMNLWRKRFQFEVVRFPKKFSEFEEDLSGLGWNISAWLEILHSTRSKKELNRNFFETIFVSEWLPSTEWNLIWILAELFQGVVNGAIYVSRGTVRGESIFFQNSIQSFISELGQKSLSFPYQSVPGTTIKNGLFSCRLTHLM